jgi:SAM-dependent methyltransferase
VSCYNFLAPWYDALTGDIPYDKFIEFYEAEFAADGGEFRLLLDLCCGTGTLTWLLAEKGYEMIAVDQSVEMLMEAQSKDSAAETRPLFLCQDAAELDLYGTVDAAICSLDGMNYIEPDALREVFRRLNLFIRPGGLFIFDIRTPEILKSLDGQIFVDEKDDVLCLWRADYDEDIPAIIYGMDIFSKRGRLWDRESEEHVEYSHEPSYLEKLLESSGFTDVKLHPDCPQGKMGRLFITAKRKENG